MSRPKNRKAPGVPESTNESENRDHYDSGASTAGPRNQTVSGAPESTRRTEDHTRADSGALTLLADQIDDMENMRIRSENRLRALVSDPNKSVLDPEAIADLTWAIEQAKAIEKRVVKRLEKSMAAHRLGPWVKQTIGLGYKSAGRFFGTVGDISWHPKESRPRRLGELYALCGLHVIDGSAPKHKRGQQSNWDTKLKTRAYLMAECCMKNRRSPFRKAYDDRREHTKMTHPEWTDGHSHSDAMRITSKAILKAMWLESRKES